jgi:putative ATPase
LLDVADGDARRLLNTLEVAANLTPEKKTLDLETVAAAAQQKTLLYDKGGEEHYNVISAFIKSMRGSDPDAAVYYLARMYEAGEDPRFIARRMVIFAAEDISLADPNALTVAVSAFQAYDLVGRAEGWIPLSEAAIYLAKAPKSNETYQAYKNAKREISASGPLPVPLHLRNAPTELMKDLNYGRDYRYPHSDAEAAADQTYLPEALLKKRFYSPKSS